MYEIVYQGIEEKKEYEEIVKKVLTECFQEEKIENTKLSITIILTTPEKIQKANKEYRNIDHVTDVLSFPMFEKEELDSKIENGNFEHEDILGDIIICMQKVEEQAKEYEHSFEREFCYMLVHGFYHLMGEDHLEDEDKMHMREKEEIILNSLDIKR